MRPDYRWWYEDRSWWYANRDDGLMLEQYTNIVQNLRIERNWTNYVHLCRDGMFKDSIRIKEDSYYDMREFARRCTDEQAHYVEADPLVLPELKAHLFNQRPFGTLYNKRSVQ